MSKLRELLNKQKEQKNVGTTKSILQSPAVQTKTETVASNTNKPKDERSVTVITENGDFEIPAETAGNSVVEQGPPAGLSGLALLRWKKEHANANIKNVNVSTNGVGTTTTKSATVAADNITEEKHTNAETQIKKPEPTEDTKTSASQTADAQKTNDGQIDVETLRANLKYLANNIEQPEMVGQVVRTIAIQLKQTPELVPFMKDADFDLIVRGARSAYKIAARKKAEQREAKQKGKKDNSDLMAEFKAAGLDELAGLLKS